MVESYSDPDSISRILVAYGCSIANRRRARGWAMAHMAKRLGVNPSVVSRWETTTRLLHVRDRMMMRVCGVLGVTLSDLWAEAEAASVRTPVNSVFGTIGILVKDMRKAKGITSEDLGRRVGVGTATISRLEFTRPSSGAERQPGSAHEEFRLLIAILLGEKMSVLWGEAEDVAIPSCAHEETRPASSEDVTVTALICAKCSAPVGTYIAR